MGPIDNHREREKGVLVYPVYSRRSGGLSVGINLFPGQKICPFDCPYCEVFPFTANAGKQFSLVQLEDDLRSALADALERNVPVKDICFSGNGEPTMSAAFPEALRLAGGVLAAMVPAAQLVLITNGAGLLQPELFSLLADAALSAGGAAGSPPLDIWLKLDAGTPGWYNRINRSAIPFEELTGKIQEFAACAPVTIQTMFCMVDGEAPPPEEAQAWEQLVHKLAAIAAENGSGGIRTIQIYGKARPSPDDPVTRPLPLEYLESRAESLRRSLAAVSPAPPVAVFP